LERWRFLSDVLGSAKGGLEHLNIMKKANTALKNFFKEKIRYRLEFVMVASCLWNGINQSRT
jgi:hypothetical protein